MGAGSSKEALERTAADDNISLTSEEAWGGKTQRSKSFDHPIPVHDNDTRESKSDVMFSFPRGKNKEDDDIDPYHQANGSSGFKVFKNRKKKTTHIDEDIDDIEKTFESLGIDKTFGDINIEKTFKDAETLGNDPPPSSSVAKSTQEIYSPLEPMRNRSQVKVTKVVRHANSLNNNHPPPTANGSQMLNNSYGRGRRFSFSWENQDIGQIALHNDDWSYNKVAIEGFDPEKFKKVNSHDKSFDMANTSNIQIGKPLAEEGIGAQIAGKYDADDQMIIASIERALQE